MRVSLSRPAERKARALPRLASVMLLIGVSFIDCLAIVCLI